MDEHLNDACKIGFDDFGRGGHGCHRIKRISFAQSFFRRGRYGGFLAP